MAKSGRSPNSDVENEDEEKKCIGGDDVEDVDVTSNDVSNCIATPLKITTPLSILIESLVKNLCKVYEPDKKNAKTLYDLICEKLFEMKLIDESYKMVEFEGMRGQYERAFYQLIVAARGGKQPTPLQAFSNNIDIVNDWSHYHREFEEIEYIAGGGFGQVFKVKHKLDGTQYAMKKIYIRSDGINAVRNYLTEVKTFASLNHSNIVQYKAAWLELGAATSKNAITDEDTASYASEYEEEHQMKTCDTYIYPHAINEDESSLVRFSNGANTDFEVTFVSNCYSKETQHHSYSTQYDFPKKIKREKRSSISEGGNAICTFEEIEKIRIHAQHHPKWATLYIQMALCQSTLKQWLEKRNETVSEVDDKGKKALMPIRSSMKNEPVLEILKQLLSGLEYIHSKNIVHHDIKPSNIFVQIENGSLLVQLGDFGLACPLQSARHSLAFGTKLYAAPEQLLGKCDPKSDMFSLGIVLLELVETFRTDMERVQCINELRKGNISEKLLVQQPYLANIILELISKNTKDRPDAKSLLKKLTTEVIETDQVKMLRSQLAEKEEEINRLKELLEKAGLKDF